MQEQYHGWDESEDQKGFYQFADVLGQKRGESTFVITGFGNTPGRREAISAMMAASKQFRCKLHIRKNESTDRLLNELIKASMIKVALVQKGEFQEYGVLGMSATPPPPTKPWWKFW